MQNMLKYARVSLRMTKAYLRKLLFDMSLSRFVFFEHLKRVCLHCVYVRQVLMYLSDVDEGGETLFPCVAPAAPAAHHSSSWAGRWLDSSVAPAEGHGCAQSMR